MRLENMDMVEQYAGDKYRPEADPGSVDLRLASSYLPGIFSVCKVVMLLAALNIMQKLGISMEQGIIVCAACLYIDRCVSVRYIMDTGACSLCVLISIAVNASRISLDGQPGMASIVCAVTWAAISLCILHEFHRPVIRFVQVPGIIHIVTSSLCVLYGFMPHDLEVDAIAYSRAVVFAVLCVLWVYTLSLGEVRDKFTYSFSGCVDRFALVLVADFYVVTVFSFIAIAAIGWQCKATFWKNQLAPTGVLVGPEPVWAASGHKLSNSSSEDVGIIDDQEVHTAFRLAQENARKGSHAR
jgi:hypothetical protein